MAVAAVALLAVGIVAPPSGDTRPAAWRELVSLGLTRRAKTIWAVVFAAFFVLSVDWWRFGKAPRLLAGLPDWLGYFVLLGILLAVAFAVFGRAVTKGRSGRGADPRVGSERDNAGD